HVIDRLLEKERTFAIVPKFEFVPEELLGPVAVPIAADEIRIAADRVLRPLEQQVAPIVEPVELRRKTTRPAGPINAAVCHYLRSFAAFQNVAGGNLLCVIGHIVPEQFARECAVSQRANVALPRE